MLVENIFKYLFESSNFFTVVYPHLKEKYFVDAEHCILFKLIQDYNTKYNKQPTINDIKLLIDTNQDISEETAENCFKLLKRLTVSIDKVADEELLIKETEKYCQGRALELAIMDSFEILEKKQSRGLIEERIKEALAVAFDINIGHIYRDDALQRLNWYYDNEECIPFDIDALNQAMGGGLRRKAVAVFMAPPKRGKSLFMVHCASSLVRSGKNVLYITCELSERMISKRFDSNLLDIPMNELNVKLDKNKFKNNFKDLVAKTHGQLVIKEFPTGTLTALGVRHLLHELKQKSGFVPDVVVLDYINICASSTLSGVHVGNTNLYIGKIVIEMRAVAVENNIAILSAVQGNRGSVKKNTDMGMDDLADSFSIAMGVDWAGAIIQNDELRDLRKYLLKTILTRWDENANDVFTIGVEYSKMKLLNLDESEFELPVHIKDQLKLEEKNKEDLSPQVDLLDWS